MWVWKRCKFDTWHCSLHCGLHVFQPGMGGLQGSCLSGLGVYGVIGGNLGLGSVCGPSVCLMGGSAVNGPELLMLMIFGMYPVFGCVWPLWLNSWCINHQKHNYANYSRFVPNFDMAYKTIKRVCVPNLQSFEPTKT